MPVPSAVLAVALSLSLAAACARFTVSGRFAEIDVRVRADLGIPEDASHPTVILVDGKTGSTLDREVRALLGNSGGGLYDPQTQTIYLDASRYRDASLYHELVHHYVRFMTEQQREECLARLYELHVAHGSFSGCAR